MLDPIRLLNDHTDLATKQMLANVVERKKKFDRMEKTLFHWRALTMSVIGVFLFYIWFFIVRASGYSFSVSISQILGNQFHLVVLLLAATGAAFIQHFDKKKEKAEKEYHDLRCEIIKKSTDLWPQPDKWGYRQEVFDMMKKEFDINLFHESK